MVRICGFDHIELGDEKDGQTHSSHQQAKDGPMTNLQANQSAYISPNTSHSHISVKKNLDIIPGLLLSQKNEKHLCMMSMSNEPTCTVAKFSETNLNHLPCHFLKIRNLYKMIRNNFKNPNFFQRFLWGMRLPFVILFSRKRPRRVPSKKALPLKTVIKDCHRTSPKVKTLIKDCHQTSPKVLLK